MATYLVDVGGLMASTRVFQISGRFNWTATLGYRGPDTEAPAVNSSYEVNPWRAELQPECPYNGLEHGLFEPSIPHPRYIVTGGAGFVGSHLVRRLVADHGPGQVKVVDSWDTWEAGTVPGCKW